MRSLLCISTVLAFVMSVGPIFADPKTEADQHIARAQQLFAQRQVAEALAELMAALALDPRPGLLYAIGQAHASLGQCHSANAYYERFVATNPNADDADVTRQAIAACKSRLDPRVQAHVDKATAALTAGDHVQAIAELEAAYAIDPRPDLLYAMGQAHSKAQGCDKAKAVYDRYLATRPPDAEVTAIQQAIAACVPATKRPPPAHRWYSDKVGLAIAGAGLVLAGIGVIEYAAARSDRDKADDAATFDDYADRLDRAKSKRGLAVIFGVAGTAAIAGGLVHVVLAKRRHDDVVVAPMADGVAVSWSGRF